jgi:hypothetical protein
MYTRSRRKAVRAFIAVAAAALLLMGLSQAPAQAATAQFNPGQRWTDTSGTTLQMHGLGIVKVGSTWYGFGEDKTGENSSNDYFQDVPCYSSTDLSHWTLRGKALSKQSTGDLASKPIARAAANSGPSTKSLGTSTRSPTDMAAYACTCRTVPQPPERNSTSRPATAAPTSSGPWNRSAPTPRRATRATN